MLGSVTLDLDPVDRGRSTVGGLGPRRHRWIYQDETIVRGSAGLTPSSSYSIREIDPERLLVLVVDIPDSDSETEDPSEPTSEMDTTEWIENVLRNETTEEPSLGPTSGILVSPTGFYEGSTFGLPVFSPIAETVGSHFPASYLSLEQRIQAAENQIAALQAELARTNRHFHLFRQARQFETARANRLVAEVAQIRGTPKVHQRVGRQMRPRPRPRLVGETLVDVSLYRVRTLIGPHSLDHETEAMPKSSSYGQTNIANHEIIGNFMTKLTELLEATLANQRGERAQSTSNDEALERFLRFRTLEFHGEVEQEAKAELF
ncbi:hypothetical protein M9H77_35366 [Catharanthus roseus]|uniref:Uncharacterized protein n=1 Tax=Catharanthus roseus TaxID=4058 RepID=A0ACB9ZRC8_CATRO|nr:hypothetical protein M9H77_35366 [Catharanthus roseus]